MFDRVTVLEKKLSCLSKGREGKSEWFANVNTAWQVLVGRKKECNSCEHLPVFTVKSVLPGPGIELVIITPPNSQTKTLLIL